MERRSQRFNTPTLRHSVHLKFPVSAALQWIPSQVGVARAEHRREPGRFLFAPAALARLFEMPVAAYNLQRAFAINLFLSRRRAFSTGSPFLSLISVNTFTSSPNTLGCGRPSSPALRFSQQQEPIFWRPVVNRQSAPLPPAAKAKPAYLQPGVAGNKRPEDYGTTGLRNSHPAVWCFLPPMSHLPSSIFHLPSPIRVIREIRG